MNKMSVNKYWEKLIEENIATEAELQLVTDINGYTLETLNDILKARTGYNSWDQYKGDDDLVSYP